MADKPNRMLGAVCVAVWCVAVTPAWSQSGALMSVLAYGAQDVHVTMIHLDEPRRSALMVYVMADPSMPPETRQSVLIALRQPEVPVALVEHYEALMAGQ